MFQGFCDVTCDFKWVAKWRRWLPGI